MICIRRFFLAIGWLFLLGAFAFTGCTPDANHEFVEGQWIFVDPHLQDVVGQSFLEHIWVFRDGKFSYEVCCLHEIYITGYYKIAESGDGYVIMDLYDIDANEIIYETNQQIRITMDQPADTIKISHSGPYVRAYP